MTAAILAWTLALFFLLARFRFFYDPSKPVGLRWLNEDRHASLTNKMCHCGLEFKPRAFAWFVAVVEVGCALLLLWPPTRLIGALGLLGILLKATHCTARAKVMEQHPVDKIGVCEAYLWRVEGLYIVMVVCVILEGVI